MSSRPKKIKVQKGEGLWLLSFSDLSMVLIAFFILMLSNPQHLKNAESSDQSKQGKPVTDQNNLEELQKKITQEVKKSGLQASAKVTYDVDGLSIEFKDSLIFSSGSANANPRFEKVVGSVLNVIAKVPKKYQLIFEGHTDDTPVLGGSKSSNWELSAARGISLLRQFEARGVDPAKMSVAAYADTRPKVSPHALHGKALSAARSANRRVVIRIE